MGTNIDYSTVSHQTIYQNITGGSGADALDGASRAWQGVATKLQQIEDYVDQAVRGIGAAQQGAAADAATQASMPLVPWVANAATVAKALASRISSQADLFAHTKGSMPEPRVIPDPAWNQDPGEWAADGLIDWLPGAQTDEERARVQAQQEEQRARDLMIGYQSSSNENLDGRPQFEAAPQVVADVSERASQSAAAAGTPASTQHGSGSHPGQAGAPSPASTAPAFAPAPASSPASGGPVQPQNAPAPTQAQLSTGYPGPVVPPAIAAAQGRGQQAPFGPSPTFGGPGAPSQSPRAPLRGAGGRGAGGFGSPPRGGGFGPRPATPSVGSSAAAEPMGAARPASAAARGGSGLGMAPFGGAAGRGGEDGTEHRRPSYLVEQDTNAIIGDLPLVAPPVIGEDQGDYR